MARRMMTIYKVKLTGRLTLPGDPDSHDQELKVLEDALRGDAELYGLEDLDCDIEHDETTLDEDQALDDLDEKGVSK